MLKLSCSTAMTCRSIRRSVIALSFTASFPVLIKVVSQALRDSSFTDWLNSAEYCIEEYYGAPRTNDIVRRLFELQGFMPLPVTVEAHDGEGLDLLRTNDDTVAQAFVYDHELTHAAGRNGE